MGSEEQLAKAFVGATANAEYLCEVIAARVRDISKGTPDWNTVSVLNELNTQLNHLLRGHLNSYQLHRGDKTAR